MTAEVGRLLGKTTEDEVPEIDCSGCRLATAGVRLLDGLRETASDVELWLITGRTTELEIEGDPPMIRATDEDCETGLGETGEAGEGELE